MKLKTPRGRRQVWDTIATKGASTNPEDDVRSDLKIVSLCSLHPTAIKPVNGCSIVQPPKNVVSLPASAESAFDSKSVMEVPAFYFKSRSECVKGTVVK